jgi:hypothetical protein
MIMPFIFCELLPIPEDIKNYQPGKQEHHGHNFFFNAFWIGTSDLE